jgi:predicted transcriptional regulator
MPKMKESRRTKGEHMRRATDHRALVLEVVATIPVAATRDAVQKEVALLSKAGGFAVNAISAMVSTLLREGLIGRRDDETLFVTQIGFDWLANADFTRALPAPHERPGRRKKGGKHA